MKIDILSRNEALRLDIPMFLLFCFAFPSPISIGTTSFLTLPVGGSLMQTLISSELMRFISSYALAFIFMIFFPRYIIWALRIAITAMLLTMLATLLLPLNIGIASAFQSLCDIFIIALEISIVVNLFSKESAIKFMCLFYALSCGIIVLSESSIIPLALIKAFAVTALVSWLYFLWHLSAKTWPKYVHKADDLVRPRTFFVGIYLLVALGSLFIVFGHIAVASVTNGFASYLSAVLASIVLYVLWKRVGINPFRVGSVLVSLGTLGVAGLVLSTYVSSLSIPSLILICASMITFGLNVLYGGVVLAERYPSRFIAPMIMLISLATSVVCSLLLNALQDNTQFLYIVFLLISVTLTMLYLVLAPYLVYSLHHVIPVADAPKEDVQPGGKTNNLSEHAFDKLSGQELRIAELIMQGYSNPEIAKILNITDNTVRGYRKSLYSKLQVHSRRELFELAEKMAK